MNDSRVRFVSGRALPLVGDEIDTDRIMPARHLRAITFDGLEHHLFGDDRLHAAAQGLVHPVDDPRFAGATVMVVNAKSIAEARPVRVGALEGGSWVIQSGLDPGERVIVDGLQKAAPGKPVKPVAARPTPPAAPLPADTAR